MASNLLKDIVIASHNPGKVSEIKSLLKPMGYNIISAKKLKINEPIENGLTFGENSLIKSKNAALKSKLPAIADDSGLCISSLNNEPGIFSARWAGKNGNFNKAIKKVYRELNKKRNWKSKIIKARFICALSISYLDKKIACVAGKVEGKISAKPRGKNGFGYDPIFIPLNKKKTFGEMRQSPKYKIDHRFKAFKKIKKFL